MAGPEDTSPLSLDPSMEELFAEAVASVERHKKPDLEEADAHAHAPEAVTLVEDDALELDLGAVDLGEDAPSAPFDYEEDSLGETPVFPGEEDDEALALPEESLTPEAPKAASPTNAQLQDALVSLETAESELEEVKERLTRREREIAAMVKRFEEAQRLYRAKVHEAKQSAELVSELRERNDHLGKEMRKAIDRIKRQNAQVEALRRRHAKEREELKRFGSEKPFIALLSVVDNFTRALDHTGANAGALREGVEIIHSQFLSVLDGFGVKEVPCAPGDPFDPNHQEAMVRVETDQVPNGAVVDVLQTGYTYHERLLRAARVSVALNNTPAPPPEEEAPPQDNDEDDALDAVIAEVEEAHPEAAFEGATPPADDHDTPPEASPPGPDLAEGGSSKAEPESSPPEDGEGGEGEAPEKASQETDGDLGVESSEVEDGESDKKEP